MQLAFLVDNTLLRDPVIDFSKAVYVAVAMITDSQAATPGPHAER